MATREQIVKQRKAFEDAGYASKWVQHGLYIFKYFTLPQELSAELPNFAMQMVLDDICPEDLLECPSEAVLFGVSEEVPESCRAFVARHEMFEYLDGCTCIEAAVHELNLVRNAEPEDSPDYGEYLAMRLKLFEPLIFFATERPKSYSPEKVAEFRLSRDFFKLKKQYYDHR